MTITSFSGTQQKCKACDKIVHFAEMMSADGVPYHKTCFRCFQCNGRLSMSGYSTLNGVLYCKPHFEQLLKETGGLSSAKFQSSQKPQLTKTPSRVSTLFSGTQDKCSACKKTVYPLEKVTVEGDFYHKTCFRCAHGKCALTTSSYAALDGILYCKPHFSQLFKEKGCYNNFTKSTSMKKNDPPQEPQQDQQEEDQPQEEEPTSEST